WLFAVSSYCDGCCRDLYSFPTRRSSDLGDLRGIGDDVVVRQHQSVLAQHDSGSGRLGLLKAELGVDEDDAGGLLLIGWCGLGLFLGGRWCPTTVCRCRLSAMRNRRCRMIRWGCSGGR